VNTYEMFSPSEAAQAGTNLGPSLVDAFAEFWAGGEGPSHTVIDRKISAAGITPTADASKERKIIDALMGANDEQAYVLMRCLLEALRQFSNGRYSQVALGNSQAGANLRTAIESVGYVLNEDFELTDDVRQPVTAPVSRMAPNQAAQSAPESTPKKQEASESQVTAEEKTEILGAFANKTPPKEVFLVHGHDEAAMYAVSHWVDELTGVKPVILSNQINRGQTLIEKFESYSADAACAIVLMTPDDEARAKRTPAGDTEERARQNVVFELGYFYGKLKRENVIVLNFGVELPGDINGLVYIGRDDWKVDLARELAGLGYPVHF
jgi:predicted nucleotide-binding protein